MPDTDAPDVKLTPGRLAAVKLLAANHPKRTPVSNVTSTDPAKPTVAAIVASWLAEGGLVDQHHPKKGPRTIRLSPKGEHLAGAEGFELGGQVGEAKAVRSPGTKKAARPAKAAKAPKAAEAAKAPSAIAPALVLDFEAPTGALPMGGLRPLVLQALGCAAATVGPVGPVALGKALGRSSGAVTNVLTKLVAEGLVTTTLVRPIRFALVPVTEAAPAAPVAEAS